MAPRRSPPLTVLVTMLAIHPSRSDCAETSGGIATKNPMIRVKLGFIISYFVVFKKIRGGASMWKNRKDSRLRACRRGIRINVLRVGLNTF